MKFVLFVEGKTETNTLPSFFKRYLDSRLPRPVGIKIVRFEGWRHYYEGIAKKVALNLSGKAGRDVIAGIGLLDLYGPTFYPNVKISAAQRYEWAKLHIEKKVGSPRFRQYFAVHETEAWLMADPTVFPEAIAQALPGRCSRPETVNFDEPPGKVINRLYRAKLKRRYRKVIDGMNLFQKLSPEKAREKCPYLDELLEDLLNLARNAEQLEE